MPEWVMANWIWIALALGAAWFLLRRRGTGRGMVGHGSHHGSAPGTRELESGDDERPRKPAGSTAGSRRHGGCC